MAASTTEASKAQSFLESKSVDSNKGSSKSTVQNGSVDINFVRDSDKSNYSASNSSKSRSAMSVVENHYGGLSVNSGNQNREFSSSENASHPGKSNIDLSPNKHAYHRPAPNDFVGHSQMNDISDIESRKTNFPISHIEAPQYGQVPYQGYSNGPSSSHPYSSDYLQSNSQELKNTNVTNLKQVSRNSENLMQGPGSPGGTNQMNFNSSNPRLPGHFQQAGTTPTLNQLLQSPNSVQRFHSPSQYSQDKLAQYSSNPHNWTNRGTPQFPPVPSSNSYRAQETNSDDSPSSAPVRPTPSPTGSRSMSPAIGSQNIPMPPRPASGQSENNPNRISHSPMAAQGGYQQQMPPPPHMGPSSVYGGKLGHCPPGPPNSSSNSNVITQNSQLMSGPYPSQYPQGYRHPSSLGNYPSYPPPGPGMNQGSPASNYDRTAIGNHIGATQGYPGFQYNQGWSSHSTNMMNSPIRAPISNSASGSPLTQPPQRPNSATPHYLRQHLKQKMGFTPQTPSSASFNGPSNLPGPPAGMMNSQDTMMPPSTVHSSAQRPQQATTPQQLTQPNIPQPSTTPQPPSVKPPATPPNPVPPATSQQSSTHQSTNSSQSTASQPPSVSQAPANAQPSVVASTTPSTQQVSQNPPIGHPDRATSHSGGSNEVQAESTGGTTTSMGSASNALDDVPLVQDEASQHSTISNASQASGEERAGTPRKDLNSISGKLSHPPTPQSTIPSPGAASMSSFQEDNETIHSPNWTRMPASPVYNCHITPPDLYRPKKPDALSKLYEMDDNPERRAWIDKLLRFMDEKGTPITTCPTISKNPLDLHKLYLLVRDHGGFIEVSKNKTWKDIAGLMGIGASSSAAYTLRKHYTKNLLPYECRFDRGGIDPQPIISQFESTSKKKSSKNASVPSPGANLGSSNSQDGFPSTCTNSGSLDGYPNVPHGPNYGYPGGAPDYHMTNSSGGNAGNAMHTSGENVNASNPFDDQNHYMPRVGNPNPSGPGMYGPPPYQSPVPPRTPGFQNYYPGQGEQFVNRGTDYGPALNSQAPYNSQQGYSPRNFVQPTNASQQGTPPPPTSVPPPPIHGSSTDSYQNRYNNQYQQRSNNAGFGPPNATQGASPNFNQSDQYRQEPYQIPTNKSTFIPPTSLSQQIRGASPTKDKNFNQSQGAGSPSGVFSNKSQSFASPSPLPQRPTQPYSSYVSGQQQSFGWQSQQHFNQPYNQQQWSGPRPLEGTSQWGNRYPYPQQSQQQWSHANTTSPSMGMRQPFVNRPPFPNKAPFSPLAAPSNKPSGQTFVPPSTRKEVTFPPDSIESVTPLLIKRKRLTKMDVQPVDPWRIMMALKSGLLGECTWALDVLNIMLFDDNSVLYFGLQNLPGLLEVLLEHFRQTLVEMFDISDSFEFANDKFSVPSGPSSGQKWYERPQHACKVPDLGSVTDIDFSNKRKILHGQDYTLETRDGKDVGVVNCQDEILISDCDREWDVDDCFDTDHDQWQIGGIDVAQHIITRFTSEQHLVPFVKVIKDKLELDPIEGDLSGDLCDVSCFEGVTNSCESDADSQGDKVCISQEIKVKAEECDLAVPAVLNAKANIDNNTKCSQSCMDSVSSPKVIGKSDGDSVLDLTVKTMECEPSVINDLTNSASQSSATNDTKNTSVKLDILDNDPSNDEDPKPSDTPGDSVSQISVKCNAISSTSEGETEFILNGIRVRDPARTLKRKFYHDLEEECYTQDEASLNLISESQEFLAKRCLVVSNILRSLSFLPGNDIEMSKTPGFLVILGKLLLLNHEHPLRCTKRSNYDREEELDFTESCSSLYGEKEWWWDDLYILRENALVTLANISGQLDLSVYPEEVARPVLDGLLHWAVCSSAYGKDPFPTLPPHSVLSPQRLSLESLSKLCVQEANVDLVLATPPFSRLDQLCGFLAKTLFRNEDQVMREFAINVLHYFASADMGIARTIALHNPCISLLISFIEQAEQNALSVANTHGINMLRENPDSMGTSLDMLRRAARTLLSLARVPDNRPLFVQQEQRLLSLVMSQILDQHVAGILSKVLFEVSINATTEGAGDL